MRRYFCPWHSWIARQTPTLKAAGSNPVGQARKTHAKGAYKTLLRVSFSMQNRGKLPFSWQFTLGVISLHIAVMNCCGLA